MDMAQKKKKTTNEPENSEIQKIEIKMKENGRQQNENKKKNGAAYSPSFSHSHKLRADDANKTREKNIL